MSAGTLLFTLFKGFIHIAVCLIIPLYCRVIFQGMTISICLSIYPLMGILGCLQFGVMTNINEAAVTVHEKGLCMGMGSHGASC